MASDADPYKQYRRAEQVGQEVEEYKWPEHPHAIGADNPASVADRIRELQDVTKHMGGLWRATAVPGTAGIGDTADIIKLFSSTADALGDQLANVWVPPGIGAETGDLGITATMPSGEVAFLALGADIAASESQSRSMSKSQSRSKSESKSEEGDPGGDGTGAVWLIQTTENMVFDELLYQCRYLRSNGTLGAVLTCRRTPGIQVSAGDNGILARSYNGDNIFVPANMRFENSMRLRTYVINGPMLGGATVGDIWVRSDL